ncbi:MAG TPA: patatin-like phospholipase family protein [Hyphomonadaceae bacterium]|nr:patatin-like phospholipase family protein [Hyphomonadaceae bacterium]
MKDRALVLGGGGPVGIAWEAGVTAGLAEQGVDVTAADFILGTSAGSVVGSRLASGTTPAELAQGQIALARQMKASGSPPPPAPNLMPLIAFIQRFPLDGEPSLELRAEIGQFALSSQTISEDQFLAQIGAIAATGAWPEKFGCTSVDTASGEFHIWRKADGVELPRGVASSCSVPGIYPPVTIKGRRWMDGGMRAGVNIDKAEGYKRVLALAVVPAIAVSTYMPKIERESKAVREAGGQVEVIVPDTASQEVFGVNLMDASRRAEITEAGLAQGRREAERLITFWN